MTQSNKSELMHKVSFEAIGTQWVLETSSPLDKRLQDIHQLIEQFDRAFSRFRGDSIITKASQRKDTYIFPSYSTKLFDFYETLYKSTNGLFTPLVGTILSDLGYNAQYSLKPTSSKPAKHLEEVITIKGNNITFHEPALLDFGAAGKGFLVDLVCEQLQTWGYGEAIVDASGDIRTIGNTPQVIGLEHPLDPTSVIGTATIQNESLCASATNRRRWGDELHHVINPKTAIPTHDVLATWVIASEALIADGLATALFFTDGKDFERQYQCKFVRYLANNTLDYSTNFDGELFT